MIIVTCRFELLKRVLLMLSKQDIEGLIPIGELDYEVVKRRRVNGEAFYILHNLKRDSYIRLNVEYFRAFIALTHRTPVTDLEIPVNHNQNGDCAFKSFIHMLTATGFLSPEETTCDESDSHGSLKESTLNRILNKIIRMRLSIKEPDRFIAGLYDYVGNFLFSRWAILFYSLLIIPGIVAFLLGGLILASSSKTGPPGWMFAISIAGGIMSLFLHELGHALTCKHFKRKVSACGLMLYWGMPVAFVDTTDAYMLPRRQRVAIDLAGIAVNLVLFSICGLVGYFTSSPGIWLVGLINLFQILINLFPLVKYDGYYALSDLLEYPDLREDAISLFFDGLFWRRLWINRSLDIEQAMLIVFGAFSVAGTALLMFVALLTIYSYLVRYTPEGIPEYYPKLITLAIGLILFRMAFRKIQSQK